MPKNHKRYEYTRLDFAASVHEQQYTLRKHLRAHKAVLHLSHSVLHFINFIHEFHIQAVDFIKEN